MSFDIAIEFALCTKTFPPYRVTGIVEVTIVMFSDDTSIFFKGKRCKSLFNIANQELENINSWLNTNKLHLNVNDTNFIVFLNPNSQASLSNFNFYKKNNRLLLKE